MDKTSLIEMMKDCPQTATQSVLAHGESVWKTMQILLQHLKEETPIPNWWRIPPWAYDKNILNELAPQEIIQEYLTYHDCGKPFTRIIDDDGKSHFSGHAVMSEKIWLEAGGDPLAARLIGMDMDAHMLRSDGIVEFATRPEAPTLLLAALAEVHSNAEMFGGTDSDSFKIKAKHLHKKGNQIMKLREKNA
jgi:hypothetical protein